MKPDTVNHPPHYNAHPSGVECITIVEYMSFNVGNAIKYLWRAGLKYSAEPIDMAAYLSNLPAQEKRIEDLKKAAWYIDREIERLKPKLMPWPSPTSKNKEYRP